MQRDRLPNNGAPLRRDAFAQEEPFRRVCAHDLEATRRGAEPLGQAEIVQSSSRKEEFFIQTDPFRPGGKAAENKGSQDMFMQPPTARLPRSIARSPVLLGP